MRTAGFVLVGGRSSRMGRDKALLPWRDGTLVEGIAAHVRDAAGNVALVGRPEFSEVPFIECIPDLRPGFGPLSGIETALATGRGELNLIHACDLFVSEHGWLKKLFEAAETSGAKCVITMDGDGRLHPLCAVYHSDCLAEIQKALDNNQLKLMDVVEELGAERLGLSGAVWNLNTPENWQVLQEVTNGR